MKKTTLSAYSIPDLIWLFRHEVGGKVDAVFAEEFVQWLKDQPPPKRASAKGFHVWLVKKAKVFFAANL